MLVMPVRFYPLNKLGMIAYPYDLSGFVHQRHNSALNNNGR